MIFIGGTGRSGTTVLSKILSKHSMLCALPVELRFLTDPDGLVNLKYSLCDQWSFYQADFAVERFEALMKALARQYRKTYPNSNLGEIIGLDGYENLVEDYIAKLSNAHYPNAWAARVGLARKVISRFIGINTFTSKFFQKSYNCRKLTDEEFVRYTRSLLDGFESEIIARLDKSVMVEHTPPNIMHVDFLKKLYPQLKFLHVYRDPRDVVSSMSKKDWGNDDVIMNMDLIEDIFSVWNDKKMKLLAENYIEIRFEDLIADPESRIKEICCFLSVPFENSMLSVDLSCHNIGRWKSQMTDGQKKIINTKYAALIHSLGYPLL